MKAYIAVPITCGMVYRARKRGSLTTAGILAAVATAAAHAYHPWNTPFALLIVFFLAGTRATAIKKEVKARLTVGSTGTSGGEGPRTHVQVLANSLCASILCILHARLLAARLPAGASRLEWPADPLFVGIVANYAAVAADTFASELGILSTATPRLITSPTLRKVPRGTNGGVTLLGLGASALGALVISVSAVLFSPLGRDGSGGWDVSRSLQSVAAMTVWGTLGSLLDSFLGGWLQQSVRDVRSGKMVEGEGGQRVLVSAHVPEWDPCSDVRSALLNGEGHHAVEDVSGDEADDSPPYEEDGATKRDRYDPKNKSRRSSFGDRKPTRVVESGVDLLDNNMVNLLMATTMSAGAVIAASWWWGVPVEGFGEKF